MVKENIMALIADMFWLLSQIVVLGTKKNYFLHSMEMISGISKEREENVIGTIEAGRRSSIEDTS